MYYWVAIEDVATGRVSEYDVYTRGHVLDLLDKYKVDMHNPTGYKQYRRPHIIYDGVVYKGGFGYNIWVAREVIF